MASAAGAPPVSPPLPQPPPHTRLESAAVKKIVWHQFFIKKYYSPRPNAFTAVSASRKSTNRKETAYEFQPSILPNGKGFGLFATEAQSAQRREADFNRGSAERENLHSRDNHPLTPRLRVSAVNSGWQILCALCVSVANLYSPKIQLTNLPSLPTVR